MFESKLRKTALSILLAYLGLALIGPMLPIPGPYITQTTSSGEYVGLVSPSLQFPLGTTEAGYSVLSQVINSFRVSVIVGGGAALMVVFIGMNIGLISGYFGGRIDSLFMGITDLMYGLPFYPFAIVYVAVGGRGLTNIIIVIGIVLWRTIARVTRSETLSLKEQDFVKSSRAVGTSHFKIMYFHILPNLLPLIVVYFMFGATWGILLEASLSFLGLGDPTMVSWGVMLHDVFNAALFTRAWWWVLAPSIALWLFIWSLFVITRALEENVEGTTDDARV
ncbi:ABC transporter permease subunit [Halobellus sp. GM3]|uniref:ABC transporter permease subunit n=1 Tax=Halobellus sp. GM3 TaxID=3458410 RepID=UPI00403D6412